MTAHTLQDKRGRNANSQRPVDRLALVSVLGAAVCAALAAIVIMAPEAMSSLTAGTAVMYDAMIWMAEICRFD